MGVCAAATDHIHMHVCAITTPLLLYLGSIAYCGSLIQWLRDNMGILKTTAESEALASKVRCCFCGRGKAMA